MLCCGGRSEPRKMVLGVHHRGATWGVTHQDWVVSTAGQPAGSPWLRQVRLFLEIKVRLCITLKSLKEWCVCLAVVHNLYTVYIYICIFFLVESEYTICDEVFLKIEYSTDTMLFVVLLKEDFVIKFLPHYSLTPPSGKGLCFMSPGGSTTQTPGSARGTSWALW